MYIFYLSIKIKFFYIALKLFNLFNLGKKTQVMTLIKVCNEHCVYCNKLKTMVYYNKNNSEQTQRHPCQ